MMWIKAWVLRAVFVCAAVGMMSVLNACAGPRHGPEFGGVGAIHLNQVGYDSQAYKAALLSLKRDAASPASFVIVDAKNKVVYKGMLEPLEPFDEWEKNRRYFRADFSTLETNGRFSLVVETDGYKLVSPEFEVGEQLVFSKTINDILQYYYKNRNTDRGDHNIRIIGTERYVDVWGGWNDAGGDPGKYLSHLSYSNFMTPQQASFVVWSMTESYRNAESALKPLGADRMLLREAFWGADYLVRILDESDYFYATVFDKWGTPGAERLVTGYKGIEGHYTPNYQAAFREGGGLAIAALASASRLAEQTQSHGEFGAERYLDAAVSGFAHLKENNLKYCDNGKENIIDDYTALLASIELFKATEDRQYLDYARRRADNLNSRLHPDGWFVSDDDKRPYFSAVEAGFPVMALALFLDIETDPDRIEVTLDMLYKATEYQLEISTHVSNPFLYPRQNFRTYNEGEYSEEVFEGFFIPHANETEYWWQGENARLASLAAAVDLAKKRLAENDIKVDEGRYERFTESQLDWILGRNPMGLCMLYGFGVKNPPYAESGGAMIKGGISNGITGAVGSDEGRGIAFAAGPESNNWRWVEQWTPHGAWFLYAMSLMLES